MKGPAILARTLSIATMRGKGSRAWQYHSRSDTHSKVACWTLLFDLLIECEPFRTEVQKGKIGFRINHVMVGPINKTLDLVVTIVPPTRPAGARRTFADLVSVFGIALSEDEALILNSMPVLYEDMVTDAEEVAIALEAKACMTEHVKSIPRLHAEILATGYLARLASPHCITVSYNLVNAASAFVTPSGKSTSNQHNQPDDARRVVSMIANALPMARQGADFGYDVIGATVLDCRNDGTAVTVVEVPPAPTPKEFIHYDRMVRALCSAFRSKFNR